jgi:hypothetical protein
MTDRYLQTLVRWAGMAEEADVGVGVAGAVADAGSGVAAGSGPATAV